jgi:hypothetical protein
MIGRTWRRLWEMELEMERLCLFTSRHVRSLKKKSREFTRNEHEDAVLKLCIFNIEIVARIVPYLPL